MGALDAPGVPDGAERRLLVAPSDPAQLEVVVPADSPNGGGAKAAADISWSSSRRINDATVVACVQDRGCANPNDSYHDNPFWGAS